MRHQCAISCDITLADPILYGTHGSKQREMKKFEYSSFLNFNEQLLLLTLEEVHAEKFFMGVEVRIFMLHPDFTG
jgi:hypothetical protein